MTKISVNGKEVNIRPTRSRFTKTAHMMKQEILSDFKRIGITEEYIDLTIVRNPLKRDEPAQIGWVVNGDDYYYRCTTQERYVDNLGVLGKVISQESYAIRNGLKTFGQVMRQFRLGYEEGGEKIKSPHDVLGITNDIKDKEFITWKFKQLAKKLHPDTETGDKKKFQELKEAYEELTK